MARTDEQYDVLRQRRLPYVLGSASAGRITGAPMQSRDVLARQSARHTGAAAIQRLSGGCAAEHSRTPVFETLTATLGAGSRFSNRLIQLIKLSLLFGLGARRDGGWIELIKRYALPPRTLP